LSFSYLMTTGRPLAFMDRGYVDFPRLHALHQTGAFFVTRAKLPMDARRVYSAATGRSTGVISDQRVTLNGYYPAWKYPEHLRRIQFKDPEAGKTLSFLTNNTALHRSCQRRSSRKHVLYAPCRADASQTDMLDVATQLTLFDF